MKTLHPNEIFDDVLVLHVLLINLERRTGTRAWWSVTCPLKEDWWIVRDTVVWKDRPEANRRSVRLVPI